MVLIKEYRICMPLTVEEYRIGQLYMIARHSLEQSENGEGVETILNTPCEDEKYGKGQFTEKRIHLSSRLPYWLQSFIPKIFYVTEKAWNYYPYTITETIYMELLWKNDYIGLKDTVSDSGGFSVILAYSWSLYAFAFFHVFCIIFHVLSLMEFICRIAEYTCSFVPKLNLTIKTKFEDNRGETENALELSDEELKERTVDVLDIAYDEINPKHYKEEEDLRFFKSKKTNRGPLPEDWLEKVNPIMCSYKVVIASFEIWGMQSRCEDLIQRSVRDVLVLGHRQAFAWVDEWISMSLADVRIYECEMQRETNTKVINFNATGEQKSAVDERKKSSSSKNSSSSSKTSTPTSPKSPMLEKVSKSWFSWE